MMMNTGPQFLTASMVVFLIGLSSCVFGQDKPTRMLSQPAVCKDHIAFVFDGDLWIANRDGSSPHRLTSHEGDEASPRFSPDGKTIAFSAQYDGNLDVYTMPVSGGSPKRLTYHPDPDFVEGFTPNGDAVLFSSTRNVFTRRYRKLFTVSLDGGFPSELQIPNGLRASYSADGKKIAYIPIGERFNQWKNYRGGTCSRVWIYDTGDHSVQQIRQPEGRCNDTDPVFVGSLVYFRSDRNGEFNLYSFDPATEAVEQLTQYDDFPINRLTESSDAIIYEQAGYLHLFNPATKTSKQINVSVMTDMTEIRPRYASDTKWIRDVGVSPSGARAVTEFRGEILTVPAKDGDVRNLTASPAVHERSPAWSPDGKSIAYFSDEGGEYMLHIAPQNGKGEIKKYAIEGHGFFDDPKWSPDGTKISYIDNSWSLYVFDIAKNESKKIASEPVYGPSPFRALRHSWSHDSAWLAYAINTKAMIGQAYVYNVNDETSHAITDGLSDVGSPVFDKNGKYLYFLSSTDAGPVKHWFAMSNNDMEFSNAIYVAVLQDDGENPLAPKSDEEDSKDKTEDAKGEKDEEDKEEGQDKDAEAKSKSKVKIDFENLDQRILALPVKSATYTSLQAGEAGKIYYVRRDRDGEFEFASFSMKDQKETKLMDGVTGFALTADGKKVLYTQGSTFGIAPAGKIAPGTGKLAMDKIQVRIDPRAEWQQIFDEVWRINRDYFYDPNMHGADWPAMKTKYQPLVADCVTAMI